MRPSSVAHTAALLLFGACVEAPPKEAALEEQELSLTFATPQIITSGALNFTMKCMDALNAGTSNGTSIVLYDCHGGPNQRWTAKSDGTVQIKSGRCLTINGAPTDGAAAQLQDCTGAANQTWSWGNYADASSMPLLRLSGSTKCLIPQAGSQANLTPLVLAECRQTEAQSWSHYQIATIHSVASGRCLDVNVGGGIGNGSQVQIYDCHGGANQRWLMARNQAIELASRRCLDVTGGAMTSGTNVQVWDCLNNLNQTWEDLIMNAQAEHEVRAGYQLLCLDVKGGLTGNLTPVQIWACHNGPNQRWTFDYIN